MNNEDLWRARGDWGSSNGGYAERGERVGRGPGNPSPFDMGGVPNRPRRPRQRGDSDGCFGAAFFLVGVGLSGVAGLVYGAVQAVQAVL